MPHMPVKRPIYATQGAAAKVCSIPHSTFSTPETTWEVQARVQRFPLSEPFDLAFSFLFHDCEPRNTCNSFTVIATAVHARYNANAGRVAWRALAMKTTLTPHLRISRYKGSVATVQIQMPFHAIVRSWTLLPPFGQLISSCYYVSAYKYSIRAKLLTCIDHLFLWQYVGLLTYTRTPQKTVNNSRGKYSQYS